MKKWFDWFYEEKRFYILLGIMVMSWLCCGIAKAEPPNYSWDSELKANIGRDGRSWLQGYFGTGLIFEGSTSDGSETTFVITNPTRDNTITIPDGTGTVALHNFIDIYFGSSATKTLNSNESQASILRGYGTSNSCTVTAAPSVGQIYIVVNNNTGNGTMTMKIANGTGTSVLINTTKMLYANGTNTDFVEAGF